MDYHLHSNFSPDSDMTMEEAIKKAIKVGLNDIAFTDHIDIDWPHSDYNFDVFDLDLYFKEINFLKEKYKDQISIKAGIEVGLQPHVLDETSKVVDTYPFDFVIASIHIIDRMDPYIGEYFDGINKEESIIKYYKETLKLLEVYDNFDVLGHIGYIKRYSPFPYDAKDELIAFDLVEDILKLLISKNKGIEINTSGYKHVSNQSMPSFPIIEKYKELGGSIITIGSDSHAVDTVGFKVERAKDELSMLNLTPTIFNKRNASY